MTPNIQVNEFERESRGKSSFVSCIPPPRGGGPHHGTPAANSPSWNRCWGSAYESKCSTSRAKASVNSASPHHKRLPKTAVSETHVHPEPAMLAAPPETFSTFGKGFRMPVFHMRSSHSSSLRPHCTRTRIVAKHAHKKTRSKTMM